MGQEQRYRIRNYCKGDEDSIVRLFNETHKGYAGFVPRTCEYWLWSCLERPGVDREGIVVVEDKATGKIVGYAVVGKTGTVWELCIGIDCEKGIVCSLILEKAIDYIAKVGAGSISVNVPAEEFQIREMLEKLGFVEFPLEQMCIHVLDFEGLIGLLARGSANKLEDFKENILFILRNTHSWMKPRFALEINHGKISLTSNRNSHSILIEADIEILTSILLGALKPSTALITRKLKIRPLWKIHRSLQLLSLLQLHDPWFHPRADFG